MRRRGERLRAKPRVRVSTIHGSKGGEADTVILLADMARRTHQEMEADPDPERRCWYVAVTRARERLSLVAASGQLACPWV
jgi:superfamily I DNA/RNA helicase